MPRQNSHVGTSPSEQSIVAQGEVTVGTSEAALPAASGSMVLIKASAANAGTIHIGATGVTVTGATAGIEVSADQFLPYLPLNEAGLAELFAIASEASQTLTYIVFN